MKCFPLGDGRSTTIGWGPDGQVHFKISLGTALGSFTSAERHRTLNGCESALEKLILVVFMTNKESNCQYMYWDGYGRHVVSRC